MSIFTKITLLFLVSVLAMSIIGYESFNLAQEKERLSVRSELEHSGVELLNLTAAGSDDITLRNQAESVGLILVDNIPSFPIVFSSGDDFSSIKIMESNSDSYLVISYIGHQFIYKHEIITKQSYFWSFMALDVISLILFYVVVLKILLPLRKISFSMSHFNIRTFVPLDVLTKDEIGQLSKSFNEMGNKVRAAVEERERFLIRVAHELRTPVTKARVAAQMDNGPYKSVYEAAFRELDWLTDELLNVEKLRLGATIDNTSFSAETVLMKALEKIGSEFQDEFEIDFREGFLFTGNSIYAVIVLRNIFANAIKYKTSGKISIIVEKNIITVINTASQISKTKEGYGFGLEICRDISETFDWQFITAMKNDTEEFIVRFGNGLHVSEIF
jgi:two-component system OmpR family sensor kinase